MRTLYSSCLYCTTHWTAACTAAHHHTTCAHPHAHTHLHPHQQTRVHTHNSRYRSSDVVWFVSCSAAETVLHWTAACTPVHHNTHANINTNKPTPTHPHSTSKFCYRLSTARSTDNMYVESGAWGGCCVRRSMPRERVCVDFRAGVCSAVLIGQTMYKARRTNTGVADRGLATTRGSRRCSLSSSGCFCCSIVRFSNGTNLALHLMLHPQSAS